MAKKIRTRKIVRQEVYDPKLKRKIKFDGQRRSHLVGKGGCAVPKRIRKARQAAAAGIGKAFNTTGGQACQAAAAEADKPEGAPRPERRGQPQGDEEEAEKPPELRPKPGGGNWPTASKKRKRKAWQQASRKDEPVKAPWTPTPRGDLAHHLKLARQSGVAVKSKNEMPSVPGFIATGKMSKAFFKNLQPLHNSYNGQGLARDSVCLEIASDSFMKHFNRIFGEHIGEWGRRHLKGFKSEKDLSMEWRQRLKQKQAQDPSIFVSKAARVHSKKEKKLAARQAAMAMIRTQQKRGGFVDTFGSGGGYSEFSA